ncbi:MAG: non-ribosomal peptide synthetase, partial [Ginsengibacter sp.]
QLLYEFNNTKVAYPNEKTIVDLFEDQVIKTPNVIAVVFEHEQLTYKQLNERANQLAHYLKNNGVKTETIVPVCIERSIDMIVGIFGILKAGGAYVPIDPEYPQERIDYMLKDTGAGIVVTSSQSHLKFSVAESIKIIELDTEWFAISAEPVKNLQAAIQPHHLAYIIYTSGSTGKPKGVMIEHKSFYSFICWCMQEFASSRYEIVYASTSICFDLSIFEIFYPLSIGKKIRILENGLQIGKYLSKDSFVLTNSVPVVIEHLLKEGTNLQNISTINMAGEPIPLNVQQGLDLKKIEVRNLYGPTEDTTYSSVYRLEKNKPLLIGKPISNTNIYILDNKQQLCPVGIPGELFIAGDGLARGYLNRPELTQEKFIKDPFSKQNKARLYKTGDVGKWLPDGNIEYIGRSDDQVKIRGYRIELGEIETVLQQSGKVKSAVVLAKKDSNSNQQLVAYVVSNTVFNRATLITFLKNRLPEYMIPTLWVSMDNMPLTANGKIDKKALPQPNTEALLSEEFVPATTDVEKTLSTIWQQLLNREKISINDNFFELGGHSLLIMRMSSEIEKGLSISVSMQALFQFTTINDLGKYLEIELKKYEEENSDIGHKFLNI